MKAEAVARFVPRVHPRRLRGGVVVLAMVLAAALALIGLDHHAFWDDEAATAIYARNFLRFGRLTAWDGVNLMAYNYGGGLREDLGYERRLPPLPVYVAAAGMRLGGATTLAARLPFVIAGVLALGVLALWVRRHFGRRFPWYLPPLLLALSPAYLLYIRNCRYYALSVLFTLLVWAIWAPGDRRPGRLHSARTRTEGPWRLRAIVRLAAGAVAIVLLLSSHYLSAAAVLLTLPLGFLHRRYRQPRQYVLLAVIYATAAVYGVAALWLANPFGTDYVVRGAEFMARHESSYWQRLFAHLGWLIRDLGTHEFLPWLLVPALAVPLLPRLRRLRPLARAGWFLPGLSLVYVLIAAALSPAEMGKGPLAEMRYVVPLAAVGSVLAVVALRIVWRFDRLAAVLLSVLLISTNILYVGFAVERIDGRSRVASTLARYVHEGFHDYRTGNEALIDLLKELPAGTTVRIQPQQMVYPAMFYVPKLHYCDQLTEKKEILPELREALPDYVYVERSRPQVIVVPATYLRSTLVHLRERWGQRAYRAVATTPGFWHFTSKAEIPTHFFSPPPADWEQYPGTVVLLSASSALAGHPAFEPDVEDADGHCRMAKVLALLGRRAEMADRYRRALEIDPELVPARLELTRWLREQQRPEDEIWEVYRHLFGRPIEGRTTWHRLEIELSTTSDWSEVNFEGFRYVLFIGEDDESTRLTFEQLDATRPSTEGLALSTEGLAEGEAARQQAVMYLQLPERGDPKVVITRGDDGGTRLTMKRQDAVVVDLNHDTHVGYDGRNRLEFSMARKTLPGDRWLGVALPSRVCRALKSYAFGAALAALVLLACRLLLSLSRQTGGWPWAVRRRLVSAWRRRPGRAPRPIPHALAAVALNVPFLLCHPGWPIVGDLLARSLAVNFVLFLASGLPLLALATGRGRARRVGLLWAMTGSLAVFLVVLPAARLAGLPVSAAAIWTGTWIVTNLAILLNVVAGGPPPLGLRLWRKDAWIAVVLFAAAYLLYFYGASRVVPPLEDHGYELQGTAYGMLTRWRPTLPTDRQQTLVFAHPPLGHVYVAGSFLYGGELGQLSVYDAAARRVEAAAAGEPFELPVDAFLRQSDGRLVHDRVGGVPDATRHRIVGVDRAKYLVEPPLPERGARVPVPNLEVELLYDHYHRHPHRLATRTPNVFLAALTVALLGWWIVRATARPWLALLVPLVYATSPEVFVRSSYGGYFAISQFSLVMVLIAVEDFAGRRRRHGRANCLLAGAWAALANHKLVLLPVAVVAWELLRRRGWTWRRLVDPLLHPAWLGFLAGTLLFWIYGLAISPAAFWQDHVLTHFVDRIQHHDPFGYAGYPTESELWWELARNTGYVMLPLGLYAMVLLCYRRQPEHNAAGGSPVAHATGGWRDTPGLWLIWSLLVAVSFSLVDWRQTKHLMPLLLPLGLAPAWWAAPRGGRLLAVSLLLGGLLAWNLGMLRTLATDFVSLIVSPTW